MDSTDNKSIRNPRGAGRPKGVRDAAVIDRENMLAVAKEQIMSSIIGSLGPLLNSHKLAAFKGSIIMIKKYSKQTKVQKENEEEPKWHWSATTDPVIIEDYLNTQKEGEDYLIIKSEGDWRAAESLLDRIAPKPKPDQDEGGESIFKSLEVLLTNGIKVKAQTLKIINQEDGTGSKTV